MNEVKATKDIVKLRIGNQYFFRIIHLFDNVVTNMTIYKLARTPLEKNDFSLTEITPFDLSEKMKKALFSPKNEVEITDIDKDLLIQAFRVKYEHVKAIAKKEINRGIQQQVLHVIEIAGFYFVHVLEANMPYPKVYQLSVDFVEQKIETGPVPLPLISPISEAIAEIIFPHQSDYVVQIDEGIYIRISKKSPKTALSIVVIAEEGKNGGNIYVGQSYLLESEDEKKWIASIIKEDRDWLDDIKESFDILYLDLLSKLYGVRGEEVVQDL